MFLLFKNSIVSKKNYFIPFVIIWIIAFYWVCALPKTESLLIVNSFNTPSLDIFFKYITYLGDGLFYIFIIIIVVFFNIEKGILGLSMFVSTSLIAQILKRLIFNDVLRPIKMIDNNLLHFVDGVEISQALSFPSGHTTTVFTLSLFLILNFNCKKVVQFSILIIALLTAYSRMYLAQHFLIDITFGALIGTFWGLITYIFILEKIYKNHKFAQILNNLKQVQK